MKYIIRHEFRDISSFGYKYYVTNFFQKLYDNLIKTYPNHSFEIINNQEYEKYGYGSIYSCMNFSIINPENDNYIVLSFFDNWKYHFMQHLGWKPHKMKKFFYAGGFDYWDYFSYKSTKSYNQDLNFPNNIQSVYKSLFYSPYYDCCYDEIETLYNQRKSNKLISKLFFRGYMWDFRKEMTNNLLNHQNILIIDKNESGNNLDYSNYLKEMSEYSACLSLPGGTEVCNRDIECFGLGIPVIRPFLQVNYNDPLISNYHYINCYHSCDYSDSGYPKYLSTQDFQNNVLYTWEKIKNNTEYLSFISDNARSWFAKNCSANQNVAYVLNNLDLEILNND
jgi:hypothetical protein